jgi:uncharacterized protein (DUF885 family)
MSTPTTPSATPAPTKFASLADSFLREEYAQSPVLASALGIPGYDDKLDDLSADAFARRDELEEEWLRRFRAVRDDEVSSAERIDRDFAISILRGREIVRTHQMWRRQPATYLNPGLQGVFVLFLHRLHPERDLVDAARSRLEKIATNVRDGLRNLDFARVPRIYLDRAIAQTRAAVRYTRELVPAEVGDSGLRQTLSEAGAKAADSFEQFARFLDENKDRAAGKYAIGEEMYTALLRDKELLPYDTRELRERGREQYDTLDREMKRVAKTIDGSTDWVALLEKLNKEHAATPDAMREEYAAWTERARAFLRERGLVTLPRGEKCVVEPSPHFQRPVLAVASYQGPPAFSDAMTGHFFVPYPPDGTPPEEVQKRLEGNCSAGIPTTSVHEAYPGHHWHVMMRKFNPSPLRKSFWTSYFGEGWALYAEQMMREQGFFADPRHELYQYEATIFRAARIIVDTSLHIGEMTFDDAVDFMRRKANLTEPNARAEVGRYCTWPTQASSYLTGMLEILAIRDRYMRRRRANGDVGALREFHDAIASSGSMPTALAERAIL